LIKLETLSFDFDLTMDYNHIYQVVNPPSTHNKCGLWAVLIGLYLSGRDHIEEILDMILEKWMTYDCGRFLLDRETGYPSTKMFSFPDGNYLSMGEIYIGRQEGAGEIIEEEGFINTDEGRTVQLFFKVAQKFGVTIRVHEIIQLNYNEGTAEICPQPRCQIGYGTTFIRIGRLYNGAHFYTLVPLESIDQNVIDITPQIALSWVDTYDQFLERFENFKKPENDQLQIDSDHELALKMSRLNSN
jgi:hypothetical protein